MRKYKLDGVEVSADRFIDFLEVGVKQLQAENEVLNEENKALLKENKEYKNQGLYAAQYRKLSEDKQEVINNLNSIISRQRKELERLNKICNNDDNLYYKIHKELTTRTLAFEDTLKDKDKIIEHLKKCNNELQSENIILRQELELKEDILSKCNDDIRKIINEIGQYNFDIIIHK